MATVEEMLCAALVSPEFVSASLTGLDALSGHPAILQWGPRLQRITVRPIEVSGGRRLQFVSFDGRHTHSANLTVEEASHTFERLLSARGDRNHAARVYLRTTAGDLQLTHSRKGVARLIRHGATVGEVTTTHDRRKSRRVPEDAPFLRATGISDAAGRIKPTARAKYRQVEQFLEILDHTVFRGAAHLPTDRPLRVADFGCGAGVLTLATYHDLAERRGLEIEMVGIDTNAGLIQGLTATTRDLGWDHLQFITAHIPLEVEPYRALIGLSEATSGERTPPAVDLVIALHACDTATDDALALAVRAGASWILTAPCCQHHLQAQISAATAPSDYAPLLRHGIVTERLGDLLTDALRAEILRAHGYRSEVIEFISTEHTGKNLMIKAVRTGTPDPAAEAAARRLAEQWKVIPALAERIGYGPGDS